MLFSNSGVSSSKRLIFVEVDPGFTTRILNGVILNPFLADRAWHYTKPLDIEKMNEAAKIIVGTHDFASFMASGSDITDTVRTVSRCEVLEHGDGTVGIYVAADGFLYNMVRIIVGTLVYVSEGKISPEDIDSVIASKERKKAGKTAPAEGLYLNKVFIDF